MEDEKIMEEDIELSEDICMPLDFEDYLYEQCREREMLSDRENEFKPNKDVYLPWDLEDFLYRQIRDK